MDIYKQASQVALRVSTAKGILTVEQLWSTPLSTLSTAIKSIKAEMKITGGDDDLSFLQETNTEDPIAKLTFEILKDVYLTKKQAIDTARDAAATKAHKEKILSLIADKKEESLKSLSVEELEKLL